MTSVRVCFGFFVSCGLRSLSLGSLIEMKRILRALLLLLSPLALSSCVSAWMTNATGKQVSIENGTPRSKVISAYGEPVETRKEISPALVNELRSEPSSLGYLDIHKFRGKINAVDEGGGQAIANAITLGTAEVIMVPLTVLDILGRSFTEHEIFVFYSSGDRVVGILIDPENK